MLMRPRKNVISFQLCSASSGQYAHPIAKPILMRLCISKSHGIYKGNKFYQMFIVFGFYTISRSIPPKAKSIFFSDQFSIQFISSNFFGFFPCQPLVSLGFPPEKLGNFPEVLFVQQRQTFPLIYQTIKSLLNKKKGKNVNNFLITSVYATSQLIFQFTTKIFYNNTCILQKFDINCTKFDANLYKSIGWKGNHSPAKRLTTGTSKLSETRTSQAKILILQITS